MKSPFVIEDIPGRRRLVSEFSSGSASAGALGAFFPARGARTGCAACSPLAGLGADIGPVYIPELVNEANPDASQMEYARGVYTGQGNPWAAVGGKAEQVASQLGVSKWVVLGGGLAALGLGGFFIWKAIKRR